jgi:membrane associated rhomboid family serine protease
MFFPIGDEESRPGSSANVVYALIAFNVMVFLAEWQVMQQGERAADAMIRQYGAIPALLMRYPDEFWHTAFTSMFMHGDWMHLFGNMLFLWIFADNVEDLLGPVSFVIFYVICGLAALATHVMVDPGSRIPVVGASGAISGVLGAYITTFPHNAIRNFYWFAFFVGVVRLPAWIYLGIWFGMQMLYATSKGAESGGVAFAAHAGGFVAGVVLIMVFPKRRHALDFYRRTASFR